MELARPKNKINRVLLLKCSQSEGMHFVLQQRLPEKLAELKHLLRNMLLSEEKSENMMIKCPWDKDWYEFYLQSSRIFISL